MYCYIEGSLFESPAQTLVNTVNTVGVMGKGVAAKFKRLLPEMFEEYQKLCERGAFAIGSLWLYRTPHKFILNFPTKKHWRQPSRIDYIERGLDSFISNYDKANIYSIAFPKLGCGNGELDWKDVKPLMERYLRKLPIDVYVHLRNNTDIPEHKDVEAMRRWLMSEPRYYPFEELMNELTTVINLRTALFDLDRTPFSAISGENGIGLFFKAQEGFIPWYGDENSKGFCELWQYFRERGICKVSDLVELGIDLPNCIMGLLLKLPIVKQVDIIGRTDMGAIQLVAPLDQLALFNDSVQTRISHTI